MSLFLFVLRCYKQKHTRANAPGATQATRRLLCRVGVILDFDNVAYHARIRDLGEAVMTFCGGMNYLGATSSLRTPISTSINFDQARLFLEGYRDNLKIPLNEAEIAHLHNEVVLAWVEHMGLGVVRGDFGFSSLLEAKSFPENTKVINNLLV